MLWMFFTKQGGYTIFNVEIRLDLKLFEGFCNFYLKQMNAYHPVYQLPRKE